MIACIDNCSLRHGSQQGGGTLGGCGGFVDICSHPWSQLWQVWEEAAGKRVLLGWLRGGGGRTTSQGGNGQQTIRLDSYTLIEYISLFWDQSSLQYQVMGMNTSIAVKCDLSHTSHLHVWLAAFQRCGQVDCWPPHHPHLESPPPHTKSSSWPRLGSLLRCVCVCNVAKICISVS